MKKSVIIILAVLFAMVSCTEVEFSDTGATIARYTWKFTGQTKAAGQLPDSLTIALARTINTVHDTVWASSADPDTLLIENGDYHAVACGWYKKDAYDIINIDQFLKKAPLSDEDSRIAGVMDLRACLPEIKEADLPDDMDEEKKALVKMLFPKTSTIIPVIPEADSLWVGSDHRELQWKGEKQADVLQFSLKEKTMEISVRLRFISEDTERPVEKVAACLVGVPRGVKLQNGTVGTDDLGRTIFDMTTTQKGADRLFTGKLRCLGLFKPINAKDIYSYGVLHVAFLIRNGDGYETKETKLNLTPVLRKQTILNELEQTERYSLAKKTAILDFPSAKISVYIKKQSQSEEDTDAVIIWEGEDDDDNHLDVIPEEGDE